MAECESTSGTGELVQLDALPVGSGGAAEKESIGMGLDVALIVPENRLVDDATNVRERKRLKNQKKRLKRTAKLASDEDQLRMGAATVQELAEERRQRFLVEESMRERGRLKRMMKDDIERNCKEDSDDWKPADAFKPLESTEVGCRAGKKCRGNFGGL